VLDEPVSALDVSIRAQIMNQLEELQARLGVSYIFIGHDLATVAHISHRIAVMYLGQIVEIGGTRRVFDRPAHHYSAALLAANPVLDPRRRQKRIVLKGELPSPLKPPPGCRFHTRCPAAQARCRVEVPLLRPLSDGHHVACHFPRETA